MAVSESSYVIRQVAQRNSLRPHVWVSMADNGDIRNFDLLNVDLTPDKDSG
jgi:hypothetical protein